MDWHAAITALNPYPQFLVDEATGNTFPDQRHTAWLQGFNAALKATLEAISSNAGCLKRVVRRGEAPSESNLPPLLEKERGIKGVRFLDSNYDRKEVTHVS